MKVLKCMAGAAFAAASLMSPAQAQSGYSGASVGGHGGEQRYGSPHDMPQDDVLHPISRDSGSQAEDLRLKGRCDQAIPILRGLVDRSGSEIAQFNLGLCLFDMAVKDPTHAADMKKEGAQWVLQAADAGLARAQSRAVVLLLEGTGTPSDPVEAQKWAFLYRANPTRYNFGLPDVAPNVTARLDAALTGSQRVEARKRANAWAPATTAEE